MDYESPEYEVEFPVDQGDPEKKWLTFDMRTVGETPIKVPEGQHIHVKVKAKTNDYSRHSHYGYSGYRDTYSKIEDQEYDFDTDYSCFNDNSTSDNWGQFPFILYA